MATLEKIRSRSGIVIAIVIGLALFAFILQDALSSGSTFMNSKRMQLAEIDGHKITITQFQKRVDEMSETQKLLSGKSALSEEEMTAIREQAWEEMIREIVLDQRLAEEGIEVSDEEMVDLIQGKNISPVVQSFFQNPQTGVVDRAYIASFVKNLDADQTGRSRVYWDYIQNQVKIERLTRKYASLVQKAQFVTSLDAKRALAADADKYNIRFVAQNFFALPDSTIKVSASDLKDYYNKHKNMFEQEDGRDIEYVVYDVKPSKSDFDHAQQWIADAEKEFVVTAEPLQYAQNNSDKGGDERYYAKGQLAAKLDSFAFAGNTSSFLKPYFDGKSYIMARIADIKMMSDSVKARHILIAPQGDGAAAQKQADSIMKAIKGGANFAELAKKYSADQGSADKGGELGWFRQGMMVKPFNDTAFAAPVGAVKLAQTNYGYHIIQVTEKGAPSKKVQLAVVQHDVEPSSHTVQVAYNNANRFVADSKNYEEFNKSVVNNKLTKRSAPRLRPSERNIAGLNNAREVVRWAYEAEKGDVSKVFELKDQFVIATLTGIREKGIAPLEQVKTDVEYLVKREKKGALLEKKMNESLAGVTSIDQLAQKLGTQAADANEISFNSYIVPNVGIEPALIAASTAVKPNTISKPIVGFNGVYVIQQTGKTVDPAFSIESEKVRLNSINAQRAVYQSYEALRKAAEIEDFRYKFY